MASKKQNKSVMGIVGFILLIFGIIGTIPLAIKGQEYLYGLLITGLLIVIGVILVALSFSD